MIYTLIIIAIITLDQLTKYLATVYLKPLGVVEIFPPLLELRYVLNDGAAFNMLSGFRVLLVVATAVTIFIILFLVFSKKIENKYDRLFFVIIAAGGIGNLIDRALNGVVVDFFNFTFVNFAVFNVADCFVSVGVCLLAVNIILNEINTKKTSNEKVDNDTN